MSTSCSLHPEIVTDAVKMAIGSCQGVVNLVVLHFGNEVNSSFWKQCARNATQILVDAE